jgi:hypothetical protein
MQAVEHHTTDRQETNARRFLALRGVIVIKETKDIGHVRSFNLWQIAVSTLLLAKVQGDDRDMLYAVQIEQKKDDIAAASAIVDYDELPELIAALDFIYSTGSVMRNEERDGTEVTYRTKEDARFGFYQLGRTQQHFIHLQQNAETINIASTSVGQIKDLLNQARDHLEAKGASIV